MTTFSTVRFAGLALISLLLSATSLFAQQQATQDSSATTLRVFSHLIVEDVTVEDSGGKPVHGLQQDDFIVKEDGTSRPIRNFEEYGADSKQIAEPTLPPNTYSNQHTAGDAASNALNVLLLDDTTTGYSRGQASAPGNLLTARQQAIRYVQIMPAGTEIAILKISSDLIVVQGFTSDKNLLLKALNSVSYRPPPGTYLLSNSHVMQEFCDVFDTQSRLTLHALGQLAQFADGVKKRKNVVWFTPGIPWLTNYGDFANRLPCLADYTSELHLAYDVLSEAQVSLYPVDPRGLYTNPAANTASDQVSMEQIATATGGIAYYNRNDLDAVIADAVTHGKNYYSLSFVPARATSDGKYHNIEVQARNPKLKLHYRAGYVSADPQHEITSNTPAKPDDALHPAMEHGVPESDQLPFTVSLVPSSAGAVAEAPLVRYDVVFTLAGDQITLTDAGAESTHDGSVEFVAMAYDMTGRRTQLTSRSATLSIQTPRLAAFRQEPLRVSMQLDLPLGKSFVRIGILDLPSQRLGTLEVPVTVADQQPGSGHTVSR